MSAETPEAFSGFQMPFTNYRAPVFGGSGGFAFNEAAGSFYGSSCAPIYHPAADLNVNGTSGGQDKGYPIFPVAPGKVINVGTSSEWDQVAIEHIYQGQRVVSHYGHAEFSPAKCKAEAAVHGYAFDTSFTDRGRLSVGDIVWPSQQIGCIWDHGAINSDGTSAAHLHLEIRKGNHENPEGLNYFCQNHTADDVSQNYEDPIAFVQSHGPYAPPSSAPQSVFIDEVCSAPAQQEAESWLQKALAWLKSIFAPTANACESSVRVGTVAVDSSAQTVSFTSTNNEVTYNVGTVIATFDELHVDDQSIPGTRADTRPDFDIFHEDGHKISANSGDGATEPVYAGQRIRTVLTTQMANADADTSLRDQDSHSIEGPIWWRINGETSWQLLVSEEFDVDDLDKNDEPDEEEWWTVPSYAVGSVLELVACTDGDDEILEPDEGSRKKASVPNECGTNNRSRIEGFVITEAPVVAEPDPVPVTVPPGRSWDELTPAEQSAVLSIILD